MYNPFSIISVSHNSTSSRVTWAAINGASTAPFMTVGEAECRNAESAVLHAVIGALEGLAKKFGGKFVPNGIMPVDVLVPNTAWAARLNDLSSASILSADRDLLTQIADYKSKAAIKFYADIADVPPTAVLARVFRSWKLGRA